MRCSVGTSPPLWRRLEGHCGSAGHECLSCSLTQGQEWGGWKNPGSATVWGQSGSGGHRGAVLPLGLPGTGEMQIPPSQGKKKEEFSIIKGPPPPQHISLKLYLFLLKTGKKRKLKLLSEIPQEFSCRSNKVFGFELHSNITIMHSIFNFQLNFQFNLQYHWRCNRQQKFTESKVLRYFMVCYVTSP